MTITELRDHLSDLHSEVVDSGYVPDAYRAADLEADMVLLDSILDGSFDYPDDPADLIARITADFVR